MAASRDPRRNAGNRMSKVLEGELGEDDFFKTTYGGFEEEQEDKDFESDQEDSADEVDSDFDISENDEIVSDQDEEAVKQSEKKRKRGAVTKAYKDPSLKKSKKDKEEGEKEKSDATEKDEKTEEKEPKRDVKKVETPNDAPSRKSSRRATAANSYLISMKVKEREEADKKKKETVKKPMVGVRRLTQEELMQEAERTERKNLKSLQNYQRLEASRKKSGTKKRTFIEPTIKFISTSMPASYDSIEPGRPAKISRDFITFSEEDVFKKEFHWKRAPRVVKQVCPVTNKPARYVDPLTNIPYYDSDAFKLIREAYALAMAKKEKSK